MFKKCLFITFLISFIISSFLFSNTNNSGRDPIIFTIVDTLCNVGEDVDVELTTEDFTGAAVELHIVFDDTKLTYSNFTSSYLAGPDVNVVGNQINIFKDFGSAQNITDTFITLNFNATATGTAELNFQNCIVLDENYNPINDVTYNDGEVEIGGVHDPIIFTIVDTLCNVGEDVDVELTTENFTGAAVELHIVFDDTKLTYSNFTSSYLAGSDVNVVGNQINIFKDFGSAQNITDTFITLNFNATATGTAELNFQNCIVLDENYNPITDVTYNDGEVVIEEPTDIIFTIVDTQCNLGEDIDVELTTENFTGAAVELHIVFDDTKLTYNNFTSSYLAGPDVNVVGNQINIFKDFGSAQNITDTFITLNFYANNQGTAALNFQNCIVLDEFYNPVPDVIYNDGVVYIGTTGITFTFSNEELIIEDDSLFFDFDVMIKASESGTKFGSGMVYIDYDTNTFGENICANDNITVTKGEILLGELVPGADLYSILAVTDNNASKFAVATCYEWSMLPGYANELTIEPIQYLHISMYVNTLFQSCLYFDNDLMVNQQYFSDETTFYIPVIATDSLCIGPIPPPPENVVITITGTNVHISWDEVSEATSYKIYSSDDPYAAYPWNFEEEVTDTNWSEPATGSKKFYYIEALN